MKSRRKLKVLLLASVATLSLMSGCSKNNSEEGKVMNQIIVTTL